ncbi:MAG: YfhO family protein, partial [Chloroflexi bacterium]|nr:YfhO family protein [Chloroflexota bacterium]
PARLIVENIFFTDAFNQTISLSTVMGKNNFSVAYWSDTVAVWKNLDALPRVFIAHAAQVLNDDAAFARLRESGFHPERVVILADGTPLNNDDENLQDQIRITRAENTRVEIALTTERAGYVVLADAWYPGWIATVDGIATPIYRADVFFRAVPVEQGAHTIVFEYQPMSFRVGTLISAISLIAASVLTLGMRRKKIVRETG